MRGGPPHRSAPVARPLPALSSCPAPAWACPRPPARWVLLWSRVPAEPRPGRQDPPARLCLAAVCPSTDSCPGAPAACSHRAPFLSHWPSPVCSPGAATTAVPQRTSGETERGRRAPRAPFLMLRRGGQLGLRPTREGPRTPLPQRKRRRRGGGRGGTHLRPGRPRSSRRTRFSFLPLRAEKGHG